MPTNHRYQNQSVNLENVHWRLKTIHQIYMYIGQKLCAQKSTGQNKKDMGQHNIGIDSKTTYTIIYTTNNDVAVRTKNSFVISQ